MFGKIFESLYEKSMVGAGAVAFAVWGYVIAKQRPDKKVGAQVTLNPTILAGTIGEPVEKILKAIEFLCSPDPKSTNPDHEGRRLIKLNEFEYQVVSGAIYIQIRNEEERREYNRTAQQKHRAKLPKKVKKGLANYDLRRRGEPPGETGIPMEKTTDKLIKECQQP